MSLTSSHFNYQISPMAVPKKIAKKDNGEVILLKEAQVEITDLSAVLGQKNLHNSKYSLCSCTYVQNQTIPDHVFCFGYSSLGSFGRYAAYGDLHTEPGSWPGDWGCWINFLDCHNKNEIQHSHQKLRG